MAPPYSKALMEVEWFWWHSVPFLQLSIENSEPKGHDFGYIEREGHEKFSQSSGSTNIQSSLIWTPSFFESLITLQFVNGLANLPGTQTICQGITEQVSIRDWNWKMHDFRRWEANSSIDAKTCCTIFVSMISQFNCETTICIDGPY